MANKILIKRGTRAQLNSARDAQTPGLNIGELYYISDEQRIAVGTANNAYQDFSKVGEGGNVNAGTLDVSISGSTPTAGIALSWGLGTGFNANSSTNYTYDLRVSPSLTALASFMNNSTAGVIRRDGINSYSIDTNTFITAQAPNFNNANGATFAGSTGGSVKLVAGTGVASGTLTLPNATGTLATLANIPTVGDGQLSVGTGAGATNTSLSWNTSATFSANTGTNTTYTLNIGPSLSALATTMTGASTGLLRKSGPDTYELVNPNTFYAATTTLNNITAPTGSVDLNGQKIIGLAEPTLAQDAATKNYVDTVAQGLDAKASVRAATTVAGGNITLSGAQTIDGVSIVATNRVLVKNQTDPNQNGIWVASASAWSRAADADLWNELVSAFVFVEEGTVNGDTGWVCTANPGQTIGSSPVNFVQFSAAGAYTAGAGMTSTGNTFNVIGTANRITVSDDAVDIASNYVGQTTITTLGTIGTGTWQSTTIGEIYGGTGQTTYATGDFLYATAANTLGKLSNTTTAQPANSPRNVLVMDPATGTPSWSSTIDGGEF